ncbi:MAG: trigger factor [Pseudomonadota bacterium]
MQVTETLNEGLKRGIKVVVPTADLNAKLEEKINDAKDRVQLKGFRPGKVPANHLRKMYGKSFMAEIVNDILKDSPTSILSDRGEKSATPPEVDMSEDENEANKVLAGEADFEFTLNYEVIPAIELKDFSNIKVVKEVVEIDEKDVEEQVERIASSAAEYSEKKGKAAKDDRVTMDYVGKIDGEAFEGGTDSDAKLVLGSGTFIPGFEDQLIDQKAGDETQVTVTFPEDYQAAHLAGKEAVFDVTVKAVEKAEPVEINDDLAAKLGLDSADRLREVVREQMDSQYAPTVRQNIKRQLLDQLDEMYQLETPSKLIDAEFNNIWTQITRDLEVAKKTFEDEDTTEEQAREEYRTLAERRVRLGLVLSEIGEKADITVTEQEMQQALMNQVRQYPGQEKEIYDFFRNTPEAVNGLRAPIFEEKTVDHLLEQITVEEKKVTAEELLKAAEEAEEEALNKAKKSAPKKEKAKKSDD